MHTQDCVAKALPAVLTRLEAPERAGNGPEPPTLRRLRDLLPYRSKLLVGEVIRVRRPKRA